MFPMQSMQDKRGEGRADAVRVSERLPPASPRRITRGDPRSHASTQNRLGTEET